jgi:hypothetical protein
MTRPLADAPPMSPKPPPRTATSPPRAPPAQLIADLGQLVALVQRRAAEQLATRSHRHRHAQPTHRLANDPNGGSRVGACLTLGRISNSATANARAATLAALLTDPENHVRFMAAEAMRYLPQTARMSQLNAILSAAATTAKPLFPFDEEDPLHFAHGRLAMLLFYSGNAYGPKGVIWGNKASTAWTATCSIPPSAPSPPTPSARPAVASPKPTAISPPPTSTRSPGPSSSPSVRRALRQDVQRRRPHGRARCPGKIQHRRGRAAQHDLHGR